MLTESQLFRELLINSLTLGGYILIPCITILVIVSELHRHWRRPSKHPRIEMSVAGQNWRSSPLVALAMAETLSAKAERCYNEGRFLIAIDLAKEVLAMREWALEGTHPAVAASLNQLAMLYQAQGLYAQAEPLHERALRIRERVSSNLDVAESLNNLAVLYQEQGAYIQAKPLFERALRIRERAAGHEHPTVAASLNNLAFLYQAQGAYTQAKPLFERALDICERVLDAEHPLVAAPLTGLAVNYQAQGAYTDAGPLFERALRIHEHVFGAEHPRVAISLDHLAVFYYVQGAHEQAKPLFERALRIRKHVLGTEHPTMATSLSNMAVLSWSTGNIACALDHLARANALRERHLDLMLTTLTESRKRQLLQAVRTEIEVLVSFHAHCAPHDANALQLTLTTIWRHKGRILEEVASEQMALRRNLPPMLRGEIDILQKRRAELAALHRAASDPHHANAIEVLARDVKRRELELHRMSATFRTHMEPSTIDAVRATMPKDAALVEFVHYRRFTSQSPSLWRGPHYVAYILPCEGPPMCVALGESEPIETAIAAALSALTRPGDDPREPLRTLDELVFAPIRRQLGPVSHWLLSPDAALHLVPFAALVDENGRHLVDHMLISYLTSGRDLMRSAIQQIAQELTHSKPLVVAAPDFGGHCDPLPGTEAEARALQTHFADIDLHVGSHATKDKLIAARGPLFVHIATHGFFRMKRASHQAGRSWRDERDIDAVPDLPPPTDDRVNIENTLDDAGLIFAGNSVTDSILTARAIADLDLAGTQLVVLSGCDTGVGQVATSEGVYGLRRALAIAGAETQVVSLWKVDDDATSELMGHYYGELRRGGGRAEGLRQAQLELRRHPTYAHPFYWAAFVLIGNEQPLRLPGAYS